MEVGEEEKEEEEEEEEEEEWIISIPLIDLRSFADDELWKLAVCSSSRPLQDIEQQHIPVPKINRAVFNESAGSKQQTYRKWDLLIQETKPTPTPTQELLAAAQSTTGVFSSSARKMMMTSTTILQSSSHQQETIRDNGHQCKIDQKHQGLEETGGRDSLQGVLQVETTLLESKEVAAAGRGDSGIELHLNRQEGGGVAIARQKRRQPNDANHHHHHHHRGDGASAHSLHQLHKSLKSTQKQSSGEEEQHHEERVAAHGSAELSMAAGMMMSSMGAHPPPPPPAAASLGQQNNPDVVESEPEIYAEMMKQQLKRKKGTWMTTANMDGKVVHAQGFPKGWTVSVGLRHKTGQLFYEYKKWKSPDGKIWGSFKEAAVHMVHMLQQEHFFNVIASPRRSCPVCEQLDPSLIHLTHCCPMRDPEWICKVCDRIFSNSEALQIHQSAHASTNQVLKDPLKASTGSRNPFEADIASTPETNPVVCGNGGSYPSSRISCHTCTTTDPSRWICKICDSVYSNSEALRIHENGHALASQMLNTKRLITDSGLQNTNCKGHHDKILSKRQGQQESESKREGDKTHKNLTTKEDGLTKGDLLEGMMDASQNHQQQLLQRSPIGSGEEYVCISCDAEQQKANPQSKHFGSFQHLSSFSHSDMPCSNNLHTRSEVAPSNSLDPIYEENPASAAVSNSSDASNYSEELPPKGFHGFQTGLDENGTHVGGGYPKVQSTREDEHGGAFESPTCHEHFHKASLFNDPLASLKTRRKKPTQVLYNSEIMGSMETLRTNFDQSITGLDMKNHLQAKLENESASVQGQPMQEIFWRMIQNSAHVGTPNGTHTSNATVTAFLEKEKHGSYQAEDMQHGMKTEIFEEDEVQYAELHQTINTNIACTEAQAVPTVLNMQSQYSSDEGGAEQDEHHKDDEFQSPAQSPYEEGDCYICGTHEKGAPEQVYCDCCGAGFHWNCVTSELQPVPEGSWMCPECEIEHF